MTIKFISAPWYGGQDKWGVHNGFPTLLKSGFFDDISHYEILNVSPRKGEATTKYMERLYINIRDFTEEIQPDDFFLSIGGDHSIAMSTARFFIECYLIKPVLIWFDAHADINSSFTTFTGNLHGMPMNVLLNGKKTFSENSVQWGFLGNGVEIDPSTDILYLGLRDVDEPEWDILNSLNIQWHSGEEVNDVGPETLIDNFLQKKQPEWDEEGIDGWIHLSFDVDGIDPEDFVATGYHCKNGISWDSSVRTIKHLKTKSQFYSMDFVEWNPMLDIDGEDLAKVKELLGIACGKKPIDTFRI